MGKVVFSPGIIDQLNELVFILYKEEYFSYRESAHIYVEKIKEFALSIPNQIAHRTNNKKYGEWYCRYTYSRHTQWYILFDTDGKTWLIRNITNNHSGGYPRYIREL